MEYLNWKATYAHRASINYRIWLERFVDVCGNKEIPDYQINDIVRFHEWLKIHYGSYSVQYGIIVIKNFFNYCKMLNIPCLAPALIKLPRGKAKSHRAVTEDEYFKIISAIPLNDFVSIRDSLIISMLWDTGVRVSELCDMDISQISENKMSAVIATKKTGKNRIIVWSEETHQKLMTYLPMRTGLQNQNGTTALFVGSNPDKKSWTPRISMRSVERIVKKSARDVGIKEKVTPHSFRHGWAHKRRDQNAPLAFIQRGLGHLNPASTFIYEQYVDMEFEKNAVAYF